MQAFTEFVRRTLDSLPSSSSGTLITSEPATLFGEHLIDIIWTVDTELDEILLDARTHLASITEQDQSALPPSTASQLAKVKKAKQNSEGDKEKLQQIVRKLLVRGQQHL